MNRPTSAQLSDMATKTGWTVARVKAAFKYDDWDQDEDDSLSQDQDILIMSMYVLIDSPLTP